MIGIGGGDQPLGSAERSGDLIGQVVGLATRIGEHHHRERLGKQPRQAVGVGHHLVHQIPGVGAEPAGLGGEGGHHLWVGVPHLGDVVVGIEEPPPVMVDEPHPLPSVEVDRRSVTEGEGGPEPFPAQCQRVGRRGDGLPAGPEQPLHQLLPVQGEESVQGVPHVLGVPGGVLGVLGIGDDVTGGHEQRLDTTTDNQSGNQGDLDRL